MNFLTTKPQPEIDFDSTLTIRNDGQPVTTSLHIAEIFDKRHDNVLRDIKALHCSEKFRMYNFEETVETRTNPSGGKSISSPAYEITKNGFMFLALGYNGSKAAKIKEAWIEAFDKMLKHIYDSHEYIATLETDVKNLQQRNQEMEKALLARIPHWAKIRQCKEAGLSNVETSRAIGMSDSFVGKSIKRMKDAGIRIVPTQIRLALAKNRGAMEELAAHTPVDLVLPVISENGGNR